MMTKWTSEKLKSNFSGIFYRVGDSASRSEGIWERVHCHTFISRIIVFSTKLVNRQITSTCSLCTKQAQGVFVEVCPCSYSTEYFNFTLKCYLKWSSRNASLSYRGVGGGGGYPYLTDAGDA